MPLALTWQEIAIRLSLSVVAGALLGLDRGEHGRPAGMRTTLLVCLAACIAMIEVNLLLATAGKSPDSLYSVRFDATAARHLDWYGIYRRRRDSKAGWPGCWRDHGGDSMVCDGDGPLFWRRPAFPWHGCICAGDRHPVRIALV